MSLTLCSMLTYSRQPQSAVITILCCMFNATLVQQLSDRVCSLFHFTSPRANGSGASISRCSRPPGEREEE